MRRVGVRLVMDMCKKSACEGCKGPMQGEFVWDLWVTCARRVCASLVKDMCKKGSCETCKGHV